MAYRLKANLSFGLHNSLINTFLQIFNNSSLDVNVLTVAESSQDLTQQLQCIFIILWKYLIKRRALSSKYGTYRRSANEQIMRILHRN